MNKKIIFVLMMIFSFIACNKKDSNLSITPELSTKQEYNLINLVFSNDTVLYVLKQKTNPYLKDDFNYFKNGIPEIDYYVYDNYIKNNNKGYLIDSIGLTNNIELLPDGMFDIVHENSIGFDWYEFYNYYPNASTLFSFSRVGFNQDSTLALLCYDTDNNVEYAFHARYYKKVNADWELIGWITTGTDK
ncbi:MAG: hypothetical protein PF694_12255 [Bacteroidetes bacterium]|jgi:hypothetical protein|nr:hypothetical protein [Bacteroidota bacterium]